MSPTAGPKLTLEDCWRGLIKGKLLGWDDADDDDYYWGEIDIGEYEHYHSPLDLHVVVPGKLIAFKGPVDLNGRKFADDADCLRNFGPEYYADVLDDFGATTVVRLGGARYDANVLHQRGLTVHELEFEESSEAAKQVAVFMSAVDGAEGLVAVHCKAGLGLTGTLIALYLMLRCGFAAREAMGWLSIMRPGSVVGEEQQQFLCEAEAREAAASGRGS